MKGVIMNFQDVRNAPIPQTGYAPLVDVIAIIQDIGAEKKNAKGKKIASVKIQDSTGETHTVTINEGQHGLPNNSMLNRKAAFALQQYNGRSGLAYSGFCNGLASGPIEQPQQPQRPLPAPNFPLRQPAEEKVLTDQQKQQKKQADQTQRSITASYVPEWIKEGQLKVTCVADMVEIAVQINDYIVNGVVATVGPLRADGDFFDSENAGQSQQENDNIPF